MWKFAIALALAFFLQTAWAYVPSNEYETRTIEGFTVRINRHLLTDRAELGRTALQLLQTKLKYINRSVPAGPIAQLHKVPIWLGVNDGHSPCSEYHYSAEWLRENGYNPDKARSVEIGNAANFIEWSKQQPMMVLHELAHAYHDRVLGVDNPELKAAFKNAVDTGLYQSVTYFDGTRKRAYALNNVQEYFAECTEAYFGQNDFFPFTRAQLQKYDPKMFAVLQRVWR